MLGEVTAMSDETMEARVRRLTAEHPVTDKKMFGGVCFLHQGNMLCGITNKGRFMARMGKEREAIARETLPGAADMDYTGKKMGGMLFVDDACITTDDELRAWIDLCIDFAKTLPAK